MYSIKVRAEEKNWIDQTGEVRNTREKVYSGIPVCCSVSENLEWMNVWVCVYERKRERNSMLFLLSSPLCVPTIFLFISSGCCRQPLSPTSWIAPHMRKSIANSHCAREDGNMRETEKRATKKRKELNKRIARENSSYHH